MALGSIFNGGVEINSAPGPSHAFEHGDGTRANHRLAAELKIGDRQVFVHGQIRGRGIDQELAQPVQCCSRVEIEGASAGKFEFGADQRIERSGLRASPSENNRAAIDVDSPRVVKGRIDRQRCTGTFYERARVIKSRVRARRADCIVGLIVERSGIAKSTAHTHRADVSRGTRAG